MRGKVWWDYCKSLLAWKATALLGGFYLQSHSKSMLVWGILNMDFICCDAVHKTDKLSTIFAETKLNMLIEFVFTQHLLLLSIRKRCVFAVVWLLTQIAQGRCMQVAMQDTLALEKVIWIWPYFSYSNMLDISITLHQ